MKMASIDAKMQWSRKLVCDLVYMVVVHESWLIQVMLENMMHDTYDMKTDTWKVTTAGNGEEEKTFNLLNLKRCAIENSECNSGEHPGVRTTAW